MCVGAYYWKAFHNGFIGADTVNVGDRLIRCFGSAWLDFCELSNSTLFDLAHHSRLCAQELEEILRQCNDHVVKYEDPEGIPGG